MRPTSQLAQAQDACKCLEAIGLVVLEVHLDHRAMRPTIEVAASPACDPLRGVATVDMSHQGEVRRTMGCLFRGCRVEWRTDGPGAREGQGAAGDSPDVAGPSYEAYRRNRSYQRPSTRQPWAGWSSSRT